VFITKSLVVGKNKNMICNFLDLNGDQDFWRCHKPAWQLWSLGLQKIHLRCISPAAIIKIERLFAPQADMREKT